MATMALLLLGTACTRRVQTARQMDWDTEPMPEYPRAQALPSDAVRLRFADSPEWEILVTQVPELLEHLRRSGKRRVTVGFEVTCKRMGGGWSTFRETSVDGMPVPVTAGGTYGRRGNKATIDPLADACP